MKKIIVTLSIITILFASCDSTGTEFADFDYQTVYFPVQNPVRTIVLGDEIRSDNSIDLEKAFSIGASVGGLYENKENRTLTIRLAPELVATGALNYLITNATPADTLVVLPPNYYNASSLSEIVIPAGSFNGKIRIDLTDAFFNDPKAADVKYVLPLVITASNKDSILQGKSLLANPLRTRLTDWLPGQSPKDYTLFAVNYTNRYHGAHFHYGLDSIFNGGVFVGPRRVYSTKPDIERNVVTTIKTKSLTEATVDRLGGTNVGGQFKMLLKFNPDKSILVSGVKGGVPVSGTGTFIEAKDGIAWNGVSRKTIYLKYQFTDAAGLLHKSKDTLVYRSSGVVYKEFVLK